MSELAGISNTMGLPRQLRLTVARIWIEKHILAARTITSELPLSGNSRALQKCVAYIIELFQAGTVLLVGNCQ